MSTTQCPACAEEIQLTANKCKHCGEDVGAFLKKHNKAKSDAENRRHLLKFLAWAVGIIAAIAFWYIAIPAVAIWYFFFNKKGKQRLIVAKQKAKAWNAYLMPRFRKHWKIITPAIGALILLMGIHSAFAPEAAAIGASEKYEFTGDSLEVTGTVKADCRCDVQVWVNDTEVSVADDRTFKTSIPMAEDANAGKVTIVAKATGGLMSKKTLESTFEATYQRKAATVEVVNSPLENGEKKYQLTLKGIPNATVAPKDGGTNGTLDAQGNGTITVDFNNAYNVQNTPIALTVSADGYMDGTTTIEVKNLKYDTERVAKEKAAEEKRLAEAAAKEQARARMRSNPLEFIEMVNNDWYMGGFGSIPIHTITLKNKGEVAYKDIGIAITYSSNSDTLIDVGAHVIYDVLPAGKTKTFRNINMGFMDGQAAKSRVEILSAKLYE